MSRPELTAEQARVVAVLVEKSVTTPQYYPMTVNSLTNAANQKSCRNPVMGMSEGETGSALIDLEDMDLAARDESGARTVKWRHRFQHQLLLKKEGLAVLVTLMLRGPQTQSELRSNAAGLGGPADAEELAAVLDDLEDRAQPFIRLLPRGAGQKEARYVHLLSGEPDLSAFVAAPGASAARSTAAASTAELLARIVALEARIGELEDSLGLSRDDLPT